MNTEKAYIIILNYKNWKDVIECLESVFRLQYKNFTAIVVDNHSQNNSLEQIAQWADDQEKELTYIRFDVKDPNLTITDPTSFPALVLIQNDKNNGFAAGNNIALRLLLKQDAYVWLLNPDMTVQENTLTELLAFAAEQPFKSIIGAVVKNYDPPHKIHLYGGGKINFTTATVNLITKEKDLSQIEYISGGALLTHTQHLNNIGLLPEDYFLYWEETDWCFLAREKGYTMRVCTTAICYDKVSTTIGRGFLSDYYYSLNGLLFVLRYGKNRIPIAVFFSFVRCIKRLLGGKWSRGKGIYKGTIAFLTKATNETK